MIYAIADIHGCYDEYKQMLELIDFSDNDTLYVLGDVVDRGAYGITVLLDIMNRPNVTMLMGNHDYSALCFLKYLQENGLSSYNAINDDNMKMNFTLWFNGGGTGTYNEFIHLDAAAREAVLRFIENRPYYETIQVGRKAFFLAHTMPEIEDMTTDANGNFCPEKCDKEFFISGETDYDKKYPGDYTIITGHTPTSFIDPKSTGRIWKGNGHIAIDLGAAFGNGLGCIRLDDMKEFIISSSNA